MPLGVQNLSLQLLPEELQDAVAEQSGLGYVASGSGINFTLEDVLDFGSEFGPNILLTLIPETGTITRSGRYPRQEWSFRFIRKGTSTKEARQKSGELVEWLENTRQFETPSYRLKILRFPRLPGLLARGENGIVLFDFVVTLLALKK